MRKLHFRHKCVIIKIEFRYIDEVVFVAMLELFDTKRL